MNKEKILKNISPLLLVSASFIWGASFVAQSVGDSIGSFTFQTVRCALATISIYIVILITDNTKSARLKKVKYSSFSEFFKNNRDLIKCGTICGIALSFAANLQQLGISLHGTETSTGRAAFLTALYIVIVPIFSIFIKKKVHFLSCISVCIAVSGLYLISVSPSTTSSVSSGDFLLIACAVFFGIQIIAVDYYSDRVNGIKLSCFQFLIVTLISAVGMFIFEKPDITAIISQSGTLFYSGVCSGGIAYTLQILGQKRCNPVLASLLMSLESVFSALSDWILRGNTMNEREIAGCVVMFAAIILAQTPDFFKNKKNSTHS